ncbi:hypothetical protein ECDEC10F_2394 [Escherichia coli DEC10F]|nr:hypothetical protein ECDEC10F_2394 [Escherichia coli DEC10F]
MILPLIFAPEMPIIAPENLIFAPEIFPRKGLVRKTLYKTLN